MVKKGNLNKVPISGDGNTKADTDVCGGLQGETGKGYELYGAVDGELFAEGILKMWRIVTI